MNEEERKKVQERQARIDKFARLFDAQFTIPGTKVSFGLDSIIGLLPVVGDTATLLPQLYLVLEGIKSKISKIALFRMLLNIGIDWLVGLVPVLGDVFDLFFKSNIRNADILRKELQKKIDEDIIDV